MLVEVSASVTKPRNGLMKKETSKTGFEISLNISSSSTAAAAMTTSTESARNGNSAQKHFPSEKREPQSHTTMFDSTEKSKAAATS